LSQGERRLAAIMFTDIAGYTTLTQRDEALALRLLGTHRDLLRPVFVKHRGREIKTIGDAFLVEFSSALEATQCAVDVQSVLHDHNSNAIEKLLVKIGIHVGDVVEQGQDVLGDAVNIASRIEPLAKGGEICVSEQVYDQVRNKIPFRMTKLDAQQLKNVSFSIDVYRLELPWEVAATASAPPSPADRNRVAVLPFANMSPDPADEYFADGMTEELIDRLAHVKGIEVIARTSVMSYKKKEKKAAEIAKELVVESIVEGSVRKAGNRVRVTAQLINGATEGHLWSEHYDGSLDDIFAVQSEIAEKVAGELKVQLLETQRHTVEKKPTENTDAYIDFLQGMQLLYEQEEAPLLHALKLFEQAASKDPNFSRAYMGLARCYSNLGNDGYMQWNEAIAKGMAAAKKALEIDADQAEAHSALSRIMFMADESPAIRRTELLRALELNPNLAEAYWALAQEAGSAGNREEMVSAAEKAYKLDPLSPDVIRLLGIAYFYLGRDDEMFSHARKTLHLNPYGTHRYLFDYYVSKGNYQEAEKELKEMERIGPNLEYTCLNRGYLAAVLGDNKTAREMIDELDATHKPGWARSSSAGIIYLALGEIDKFFEYMFMAVGDGTVPITTLRYNPLVEKARSDPRFAQIFRRAGVPYAPSQ
jgi:adenylate cyclase